MQNTKYIVHHCTATPQNTSIESIKRYWRVEKGWTNPGYHFIIPAEGPYVQLLDLDKVANGVQGYNSVSKHICYIGGVGPRREIIDNRTESQKEHQRFLTEMLSDKYPSAIIQGHRDFSPDKNRNGIIEPHEWMKSCPSFSVAEWLREIKFKSRLEPEYMTTTGVNIRTGPGTHFPKAAPALNKGVVVRYLGADGPWKYVAVDGSNIKGFVHSNYILPM